MRIEKTGVVLLFALAAFVILILVSCGDDPVSSTTTMPVLTTAAVTEITETTAQCGGNVTSDGGADVTARGVCWSTNPVPTVANDKTTESGGTGSFTSSITGLTASTVYYVRAYATNSVGTRYGDAVSVSTLPVLPVLTTATVIEITQTTAKCGGSIASDGGATVVARGVCWSTNATPTVADNISNEGSGVGSFTSDIIGLLGNTTYYVMAYATNSVGTGYGDAVPFLTAPTPPVLTTAYISAITQSTAQCGGTITSDGGATVTARGICWRAGSMPTIADNKTTDGAEVGSFASSLTGLALDTTYYIRTYGTNAVGTGYGNARTLTVDTVIDIDGNVYLAIKIGDQWWMAENLKTTHYVNGDAIPNVTDNAEWWDSLTTGAYCEYNNDVNNVATYGRLYNWYAVGDPRNIAPAGWHVATDADWQTLVDYLGGFTVAGGKLKEAGTTHWRSPNTGATNESGFTALPGGYRYYNGYYINMVSSAWFWSSTEHGGGSGYAHYLSASYYTTEVSRSSYRKDYGFSVRCVKD